MELIQKLEILADAAKYDVSCASSGAGKKFASKDGKGLGSTEGMGICHSYTPDGRCISLLKILLTNFCIYECSYCINRNSSNVARARFSVSEVVKLTIDFYKRNYIEGLFLSSGIIQSADYTMEQMVTIARRLREEEGFRGYIHLKTIPEASEKLMEEAGKYADRLSINIELPQQESLARLAPEKSTRVIKKAMGKIRHQKEIHQAEAEDRARRSLRRKTTTKSYAPAGQSTQIIVGADNSDDRHILLTSSGLYHSYQLKRVYFSAFSPIPDASSQLPLQSPPLQRENRLYQADWLMRFYQFRAEEIAPEQSANLDLDIDPKLSWAIRNRQAFPVDLNRASRHWLLRVPGLGVTSVDKILKSRRCRKIRLGDLARLRVNLEKLKPFIQTSDYHPGRLLDIPDLKAYLLPESHQLSLFG